jgi:hypothetical protein
MPNIGKLFLNGIEGRYLGLNPQTGQYEMRTADDLARDATQRSLREVNLPSVAFLPSVNDLKNGFATINSKGELEWKAEYAPR